MRSFLLPTFSRAFFRGSHTIRWATCGLSRSYNQAALVPSSKVTDKFPPSPRMKSRMVLALVSRMDSITSFPSARAQPCGGVFVLFLHPALPAQSLGIHGEKL